MIILQHKYSVNKMAEFHQHFNKVVELTSLASGPFVQLVHIHASAAFSSLQRGTSCPEAVVTATA